MITVAAKRMDEKINVWSSFVVVSPVVQQRADLCLGSEPPLRAHLAAQIQSFLHQRMEVCVCACVKVLEGEIVTEEQRRLCVCVSVRVGRR